MRLRWLWACLASACLTTPPPAAPPTKVTLLFSSELKGYITPCGCSENMRGGVGRLAHVVEEARAEGGELFYFDSGDGLFGAASIPDEAVAQQELKARTLAQVFTKVGLTARVPGKLDDARGQAFRASLGLPELEAPGTWLKPLGKGAMVAVVAARDGAEAVSLAKKAREKGASFVAALVLSSLESLVTLANEEQSPVDLFVASAARDELSVERSRQLGKQTKLISLQNKGRTLLEVDLVLAGGARPRWKQGGPERDAQLEALDERMERLKGQIASPGIDPALKAMQQQKLEELVARRETLAKAPLASVSGPSSAELRLVPLEASLPEAAPARALVEGYEKAVGELNLAWAKEHGRDCEAPTKEQVGFVGSATCAGCHAAANSVFQGSKHARAYEALEKKGNQYNLECIGCHVTGWRSIGGVCRVDKVEGRGEVGCESCHGAGSAHVSSPSVVKLKREVSKEKCVTCHDRENSPHFAFDRYLPHVLGPGHGG